MEEKIKQITEALIEQNLYNPYSVFQHPPDFYKSEDNRYEYEIHCIKWNTKSTRMSIYLARLNDKTNKWVFARKQGIKRNPHGEKMR